MGEFNGIATSAALTWKHWFAPASYALWQSYQYITPRRCHKPKTLFLKILKFIFER